MALADQLKRTLGKEAPDSEIDSSLSISVPDASLIPARGRDERRSNPVWLAAEVMAQPGGAVVHFGA
jgi:hypothetical protein